MTEQTNDEQLPQDPEHEQDPEPQAPEVYKYAQLNAANVCIAISYLSGEITADNVRRLAPDEIVLEGDIWDDENGVWIPAPPPEPPEPPGPSLREQLEALKQENQMLGQQLVERELEALELRTENELLGNTIVDIDLRLLAGGL